MTIPALEPTSESGLLPGASSQLTAVLDDLAGSGHYIPLNRIDEYEVDWRLGTLEGWDSPDLEEGADKRSGSDGMWDTENHYGGRMLQLTGMLSAPTYAAREAAEYRLRQVVSRNRYLTLRVEETTPKQVQARRSGRVLIKPVTPYQSNWSVSLLAPDPRKYSVAATTATIAVISSSGGLAPPWTPPVALPELDTAPSQATLTNEGIYDSPPTITIYGPGSGISVHNTTTDQHLDFDQVLGESDYLTVDVASGTVLLNGTAPRAPRTGSTVVAQFLADPGENLYRIFGTLTGSTPPSAVVSLRSAWI